MRSSASPSRFGVGFQMRYSSQRDENQETSPSQTGTPESSLSKHFVLHFVLHFVEPNRQPRPVEFPAMVYKGVRLPALQIINCKLVKCYEPNWRHKICRTGIIGV